MGAITKQDILDLGFKENKPAHFKAVFFFEKFGQDLQVHLRLHTEFYSEGESYISIDHGGGNIWSGPMGFHIKGKKELKKLLYQMNIIW